MKRLFWINLSYATFGIESENEIVIRTAVDQKKCGCKRV